LYSGPQSHSRLSTSSLFTVSCKFILLFPRWDLFGTDAFARSCQRLETGS
jgi:hypothetical protein